MLHGAFTMLNSDSDASNSSHEHIEEPNAKANKFYKLVEDAEHELYPDYKKFNKLSFVVQLLRMKYRSGWSNTSFILLL